MPFEDLALGAIAKGLGAALGGTRQQQTVTQSQSVSAVASPVIALTTGGGAATPSFGGTVTASSAPVSSPVQPGDAFGFGYGAPAPRRYDDLGEVPIYGVGQAASSQASLFDSPVLLLLILGGAALLLFGGGK